MTAKSTNTEKDWSAFDAHTISGEEYNDIPELTDEFFEQADLYEGEKLIRAGQSTAESPKVLVDTIQPGSGGSLQSHGQRMANPHG